jgi:Protein of unknown function (DUF1524)
MRRVPRRVAIAAILIAVGGGLSGCKQMQQLEGPSPSPSAPVQGAPPPAGAVPPGAAQALASLAVAPAGSLDGYTRDAFGQAWSDDVTVAGGHNGCDTRNDVLRRDLTGVQTRPGTHDCVVIAGTLQDPYTAKAIQFTKAKAGLVQIDHIVPLAYAWRMGARNWPPDKRRNLANDPANLLAVDGSTNESKGDEGPAQWLPPNTGYRCAYAAKFVTVAATYGLPVTPADKQTLTQTLQPCH